MRERRGEGGVTSLEIPPRGGGRRGGANRAILGRFADTPLEPSGNAIFCLTLHWQTVPASPLQSDLDDAVAMHFVIAKNIKRGAIYTLSLCSRQRRTLYEIGRLLG